MEELRSAETAEPSAEESQIDKWGELMNDEEPEPEPEREPEPAPEPEPESETPQTPAEQKLQEQEQAPVEPTQEQLNEFRTQFESAIASRYAFSEADALQLQTEPEKVLPKLAAKMYADVLEDVNRMIQQSIPVAAQYAQQAQQAAVQEERARGEFFSAWPELRNYEAQVLAMGDAFRKMNPNASPQETIQRVGEITMAALGLQRKKPAQQPPYKPAGAGRVAQPAPQPSKWEQFLTED